MIQLCIVKIILRQISHLQVWVKTVQATSQFHKEEKEVKTNSENILAASLFSSQGYWDESCVTLYKNGQQAKFPYPTVSKQSTINFSIPGDPLAYNSKLELPLVCVVILNLSQLIYLPIVSWFQGREMFTPHTWTTYLLKK